MTMRNVYHQNGNNIRIKLTDILKERGYTQMRLAQETGIRPNAISQLTAGFRKQIHLEHIEKIMKHFDITDFNEILEILPEENE
ncbi:Cro/C1-type HTH DNA-binding domain-containing protein [Halobacillus dabanensis]|uniref:Cro/C1-type HTH DNA-binding domain-containing protein n=1 Tax=Halobacillus dabanensis TaxID=240302 RepID=A0A1I3RD95_HALDA|nr:helix-turn-helix transcriptional regulator [Halobacillus dabanensis]SFJ43802.1 Cro/C1-type HTH DNA-binding domain-containing protein [Halobacillus dabanensis]